MLDVAFRSAHLLVKRQMDGRAGNDRSGVLPRPFVGHLMPVAWASAPWYGPLFFMVHLPIANYTLSRPVSGASDCFRRTTL
jgi:hypothetical protein